MRISHNAFWLPGAVALLAAALPIPAQVDVLQPPPPAATPVSETPDLWLVQLASAPSIEGTPIATLAREKSDFRAAANNAGIRYTERMSFQTLWNGLSVRVNAEDLAKLRRVAGVTGVYPMNAIPIPPVQSLSDPTLMTALSQTGADIVQNSLGYTGAGVRVAIIDTGVDYDHPAFGGSGVNGTTAFPSSRVVAGYDFVGDAFTGGNTPIPDNNPDDCNGHGTHVAGIVGANDAVVKGVAPNVVLGAYRVFGCNGSTTSDIMIAAMERVYADGMQVVNMSIVSAFAWDKYPTAQAANRLVAKGVVVVASIGNNGSSGLYAAGAPGVGTKVIGVASFDNTHLNNLPAFSVSPDNRLVGYFAAVGAPAPPTAGTFPLARTGTPASTTDACSPLPAGSLTGKVALIRAPGCLFYTKARNAQLAGAVGVIIYSASPGLIFMTVANTPPVTIPVASITRDDGLLIDGRIAAGATTMTWTNQSATVPVPTGGLISSFSSFGLTPELDLKPDIGAPGGYIYSTYPLEQGGYTSMSGTSMSSPHVAGAVALLLQAAPHTPPQAVREILQNNSLPRVWFGNPALGFIDNVHRQGAGMLQIDKAILSKTRISPAKLALGESQAGPITQALTIRNNGPAALTYSLSHQPALATGPNSFSVSFYLASATVSFSQFGAPVSNITVPPGGSASIDATFTAPPILADRGLFGGYVILSAGADQWRVPYAGLKGDYQTVQLLVPTPAGFPWLVKRIGSSYVNQPLGASYTMAGADIPYIGVHLDHPARTLRMEVFDAVTGKAWHRAIDDDFIARNSTSTGAYLIPWDGITLNGKSQIVVPNGSYTIKLSVQKPLGDSLDWETWTSPVITIARP